MAGPPDRVAELPAMVTPERTISSLELKESVIVSPTLAFVVSALLDTIETGESTGTVLSK